MDEILKCEHSNKSYRKELLIMLYRVVLSFKSVNEILKCEYSSKSYMYGAVLFVEL